MVGATRLYTTKQMGDACEMVVAAELTLAGVPALKVPDNWPGYDVVAQPPHMPPQRISVKSRTFKRGSAYVGYYDYDQFDWLAVVLLPAGDLAERELYIVPRAFAEQHARRDKVTSKTASERYFRIDEVSRVLGPWKGNFQLSKELAVSEDNATA